MFIMLPGFKIAVEKAKEVKALLPEASVEFVALADIVDVVEKLSGYEIRTTYMDFSKLIKSDSEVDDSIIRQAGAMLSTVEEGNKKIAFLIVNEAKSPQQQRFATVHELGHLITKIPNYSYVYNEERKFTISTQINADITYISNEKCKSDKFLMAEQVANIFALLVLIPEDLTIQRMVNDGVQSLSKEFGVTEEALYSRLLISNEMNAE